MIELKRILQIIEKYHPHKEESKCGFICNECDRCEILDEIINELKNDL